MAPPAELSCRSPRSIRSRLMIMAYPPRMTRARLITPARLITRTPLMTPARRITRTRQITLTHRAVPIRLIIQARPTAHTRPIILLIQTCPDNPDLPANLHQGSQPPDTASIGGWQDRREEEEGEEGGKLPLHHLLRPRLRLSLLM